MVKIYLLIETEDEDLLDKYHSLIPPLYNFDNVGKICRSVMEALPGQKAGGTFSNVYEIELSEQEGVSELKYYLRSILLPSFEGKAKIKLRAEDLKIEFMEPSETRLNLLVEELTQRINTKNING